MDTQVGDTITTTNTIPTNETTYVRNIPQGDMQNTNLIPTNEIDYVNNIPQGNNNRKLKICGLNVCGLNSKLNNGYFSDYLNMFDIFCITESKVSIGNNINNYSVFNLNKSKKYPLPAIHGLQVYIKDSIAGQCCQILDIEFLCKSVLWLKISKDFIIGALYIPHQGSKYYCSQFFDDLSYDICSIRKNYDLPLILIGDLNSRTGELNDILLNETCDDVLDISNFMYPNILNIFKCLNVPIIRTSQDKKVNKNGKALIDLCHDHELCIVNGRFGDDKNIGNITCTGKGKSVVDYVLCTPELLANITNFTVDPLDKLLSDKHKPIHITVNLAKNLPSVQTHSTDHLDKDFNITEPIKKSEWDKSKSDEYQKHFDMDKIQNMSYNLSLVNLGEITEETVNVFSGDLKNLFTDPAKATGMFKQLPISNKVKKTNSNKPWFNKLCIESKNNYKLFKKSLPKQNNDENAELIKLANKHKKLIRKEKRKYDQEFNQKLKLLKSSNPAAYWKIINKGKKK